MEDGFTRTSVPHICKEIGISPGNFTFHFPTKEHLLLEMTKMLVLFHFDNIMTVKNNTQDDIIAYCWEITMQIVMCNDNPQARDLYLAIYSHTSTLEMIQEWTARKNLRLFGNRLPDWTYERYRLIENVTSSIERGALAQECGENYTLEDKITLTLDCLLSLYNVEKSERVHCIDYILGADYHTESRKLLKCFTQYVEQLNTKALQNAAERRTNNT